MDTEPKFGSRLTDELESLRQLVAELETLVIEPSPAVSAAEPARTIEVPTPASLTAEQPVQDIDIHLPEIFDKGPFGMALIDTGSRLLEVNEALCRLLGYSNDELTGSTLPDISTGLDPSAWEQWIGQALKAGAVHQCAESRLLKKSGDPVCVLVTVSAIPGREINPSLALLVCEEIGERKTKEKAGAASEDRYRDLYENAGDIMYTQDLAGNITSFNQSAETSTGYSSSDALKMNIAQLIAPDSLEAVRRQAERQIAGEKASTCELSILTKDERRLVLEISSRLIFREGRPAEFQVIGRDITARKQSVEALQRANEKLEAWVKDLEQRAREMTLLSEMADMLRACYTMEEAYSVIVRIADQIFPLQVGALYVITPSRNHVQAVAMWGSPAISERAFMPDECWALRRGRLHWVEDTRSGLLCRHLQSPPPAAYLCVPMMAQSEALGVLHVTQPENRSMVEAQRRLAVAMAEHIAMALSNLRLHETLRSQSIRDPLSGLFNRRFMEECLELELRRAARGQHPLGIIMVDLDNFKGFNQVHGNEAGDSALRDVGALLQANVRKEDLACRLSGHRFAVILPQGSLEVTQQRAGNLLGLARDLEVKLRSQPVGKVTASMGVSIFPQHGRTVEALLRAAEAALQRAQEAGGNQIITAK